MPQFLKKILLIFGLDAKVLPIFLLRIWQIIVGGLMIVLIPLWLNDQQQGYYFTFGSLIALQVFFELGLNQVVLQVVSHDFARVKSSSNSIELLGCELSIDRLAQFTAILRYWYAIASILFFIVVGFFGVLFFLNKGLLPLSAWLAPWVALVFFSTINLYFSATLSTLEGCGMIDKVARMRLHQSLIGSALMCIGFATGAGLWSVTIIPMISAVYTGLWLKKNSTILAKLKSHLESKEIICKIKWFKDIFPFQWRIAVSWISGYFIFQLFIPLTFNNLGAVEAGRLGITIAIFTGLLTVGMSWTNARLPEFGSLISNNLKKDLNILFISTIKYSVLFIVIGILLIISAILFLVYLEISIVERFASIPVVLCMSFVTIVNSIIFALASYMRAHKEEPLLYQSITVGIAVLGASLITSRYGVFPMMLSYALINFCVALPWAFYHFRKYYFRVR